MVHNLLEKEVNIKRSTVIKFDEKTCYNFNVTSERDEINAKRLQDFIDNTLRPFDRNTPEGHVTATAFIIDPSCHHALMLRHKKLNMWLPPGGHCDNQADALLTAVRETYEETGLSNIEIINNDIYDIDIHIIPKNTREPQHYHYDVRFLFFADITSPLKINDEEASHVEWVNLEQLDKFTQLPSVLILRDKMEVI